MESNICKFKRGETDLGAILAETEKVTRYNALPARDALYLRLLAEELVSMLPSLVQTYDGEFWVTGNGADYELHVKMKVEDMDILTREGLIRVSRNNKNASAIGITGKIRAVFDYMVLGGDEAAMTASAGRYGFAMGVDFPYVWSLQGYRDSIDGGEHEAWDELEKSIIAKLSDDVIVGVRGKSAHIIIKKSFEEKKV